MGYDLWIGNDRLETRTPGAEYGLSLSLMAEQNDFFVVSTQMSLAAGFRVSLHMQFLIHSLLVITVIN